MTTEWSDGYLNAIGSEVGFWVDQSSTARLFLARSAYNGSGDAQSYLDFVVGGVEGEPLDFALRQGYPPAEGCAALNRDLGPGSFVFSLYGPNEGVDGLMVGTVGSLTPEAWYRDDAPGINAWWGGSDWVLRQQYGSVLTAYGRGGEATVPIYEPAVSPLGAPLSGKPWVLGHQVIFGLGAYVSASIWAYDEALGTHPLLTFGDDLTRGAANVGTDGVDLVWTQGEGKVAGEEGLYRIVSIMTSPFTTDPAALASRRLRSDMSTGIGTHQNQFAVGCGYAGRILATGRDAEIVRLQDGAAWVLSGNDEWKWNYVLGFTCKELFITVFDAVSRYGIARLPLDSLGDPLAPD
ncbi:MAG: hypothetical protein U0271_31815 [Polyangiaceae bacterium]